MLARQMHMSVRRIGSSIAAESGPPTRATFSYNPKITPPRQAWVENFIGSERKLLGIIDLHPRIFGAFPRIDHASNIISWQKRYRNVSYISMPTRNELPGGTRRPWPLKGTGRARHKSVNSPIFLHGGWAHGPRGPVTGFKLKPIEQMVRAMNVMLSLKLSQDDIRIVDSINTYEAGTPLQIEQDLERRRWGPSALIVDKCDVFPENLVQATDELNHVNLMTCAGINPLSLAKHETLVITLAAVREIENKLIDQITRVDLDTIKMKYRQD